MTMLNHRFWQRRKVFLTGHTGFKGSWLSIWLDMMGAHVTGYALEPPTQPSLFQQANVGRTIRSVRADIRDFDRLKNAIGESSPDVIIHLAAQSVVRRGYEDPIETYASNVMGTVHVLEAVRQLQRPCVVVNVTSDKCYSNQEWVWGYRESDPMGGRDPYSSSKGCAELVASAYRESYFPPEALDRHGIALASARAGNAIGGGDWTSNQLIPDLIRAFLTGQPCQIRNPSAVRPWQFVLEPLHGYLLLCERLSENGSDFASGWNFGPADADAKCVSWIAHELAQSWGVGAQWIPDAGVHPREAQHLKLDTSKASALLNWHPVLPLRESLEWIVEWYRAYQNGRDLALLTRTQIARYEALPQRGARLQTTETARRSSQCNLAIAQG
jgi:CDP-glucose 4,6-dehydratase